MAEFENVSEINENFNTIKTLLNSIRAQGILNTSDVDKLLSGINSKLEKLNTEEDIDLIKIFLTELKQNLEERHAFLVTKFGAIESLFSNLLKNSSEMLKSSEVKELFDIVATNLSVFSREVVSQKDALTDISLRLETLRADDTKEKNIIKNIALLKPDLERLNNGFDSIVVNLNDNFKSIIKTITSSDNSEFFNKFSNSINNLETSSNMLISAMQMLDKKTEGFDEALKNLPEKEDITLVNRRILELFEANNKIIAAFDNLNSHYDYFGSLAEKIDASVDVIAGLKAAINQSNIDNTNIITHKLDDLESKLEDMDSDEKFVLFKRDLEQILQSINQIASQNNKNILECLGESSSISNLLKSLNIDTEFANINKNIGDSAKDIKELLGNISNKKMAIDEANFSKLINDISTNAEDINSKFQNSCSLLTDLCQRNYDSISGSITSLKELISQVNESNDNVNSAIFSNLTDRLSAFESMLTNTLDSQKSHLLNTTDKIIEQMDGVKTLSGVLDYKMDSAVIEVNNIKSEFGGLKTSIDSLLAQDFVNVVKDIRVDLFAAKQDMINSFDGANSELSDKFTNDLYAKYELLISKLDSVDDEFKKVQGATLQALKPILENISTSIVDVLTYVSEHKDTENHSLRQCVNDISVKLNDSFISYVENIRNFVDVVKTQINTDIKTLSEQSKSNYNKITGTMVSLSEDLKKDINTSYVKLSEIETLYENIKTMLTDNSEVSSRRYIEAKNIAEEIKTNYENKIEEARRNLLEKVTEFKNELSRENHEKLSEITTATNNLYNKSSQDYTELTKTIKEDFLKALNEISDNSVQNRTAALSKILENFVSLKEILNNVNDGNNEIYKRSIDNIKNEISTLANKIDAFDETIDQDLARQVSILESNFESLISQMNILFEKADNELSVKINREFGDGIENVKSLIEEKLDTYKNSIQEIFDSINAKNREHTDYFVSQVNVLNNEVKSIWTKQAGETSEILGQVTNELKNIIDENIKLSSLDFVALKTKLKDFENIVCQNHELLSTNIKANYDALMTKLSEDLKQKSTESDGRSALIVKSFEESAENFRQELNSKMDTISTLLNSLSGTIVDTNIEKSRENKAEILDKVDSAVIKTANNIDSLKIYLQETEKTLTEECSNLRTAILDIGVNNDNQAVLVEKLNDSANDLKDLMNTVSEGILYINKQNEAQTNSLKSQTEVIVNEIKSYDNDLQLVKALQETNYNKISESFDNLKSVGNNLISSQNEYIKDELANSRDVIANSIENVKDELISGQKECIKEELENANAVITNSLKAASDELINSQKEYIRNELINSRDILTDYLKSELNLTVNSVEKETDTIVAELIEQFDILKRGYNDNIVDLTSKIEDAVNSQIYSNIEDLKSYFDVKIDNSSFSEKLDSLKLDIMSTFSDAIENLNKMLNIDVFKSSMEDYKLANEVLLNTVADGINNKIKVFFDENVAQLENNLGQSTKEIESKIVLFNKQVQETIVDKYEELKLLSNSSKDEFDKIAYSINEILSAYSTQTKNFADENSKLINLLEVTNDNINSIDKNFIELKNQLMSKSFGEAFKDSITTQISDLEGLVTQQMDYIQDIGELCELNLPNISEMHTLIKHGILTKLNAFSEKMENQDIETVINVGLKTLKSDIITQFLDIFNQISFITEEEEIIDYIQERHNELMEVLSHIVVSADEINGIKNEIKSINEKINTIISSQGDIDYVYSLQDLESDIANLRLVLNDMKNNDNSSRFDELLSSTSEIYKLIEAIKSEIPNKFEMSTMADNIESISTRTNKLILASDESYKTLKDSLQDFKLVINDLDERTKNFARESGMDRVNEKLGALNTMMQNGAKTNQVFNQVFEYLAEWVDNAGIQINNIADKVETLDDIGQIKVMLSDIKTATEDDSSSVELVEALGAVFEKQTKRISSLESKLDKIIVETTINNKNNKPDLSEMEDTLNSFLVAIESKMSSQQEKISLLESKLNSVVDSIESNDTIELTKKVGGMDKHITKLNKTIEKIASHVIEK